MSVSIENLTDKPLWLRLNSGAALSVMPRSSVPDVQEGEVRGNAKLRKLHDNRVIRTEPPYGESAEADAESTPRKGRRTHRTES